MSEPAVPIDRETGRRFVRVVKLFLTSEVRGRAIGLFARIIGFALADNFRRIMSANRNLSFFTTGYNYLIQILPTLIVAPLFIHGEVGHRDLVARAQAPVEGSSLFGRRR